MNYYLIVILAILIGGYFLELIIDTLNVKHAKTDLPREFEGTYDADKYRKSQEYLKENTRFSITHGWYILDFYILFFLKNLET